MEVYRDAAIKIAEQDSDLIIYCGIDGFILSAMMEFFKEMDYTPKGLISTTQEHDFSDVGDFLVRTTTVCCFKSLFPEMLFNGIHSFLTVMLVSLKVTILRTRKSLPRFIKLLMENLPLTTNLAITRSSPWN